MKKIFEFLLELLVVFVGVFAAFQLNDYQQHRKDQQAKIKYYKTFRHELQLISGDIRNLRDTINSIVDSYEKEISQGNRPPLVIHSGLFFQGKAFVVESAFNDAHFTTLGQEFIVSISRGANLFYWIKDHLNEYQGRVKDLLYNTPYRNGQFYEGSGLRPEYQWYLDELKMISKLIGELIASIEEGAIPATDRLIDLEKLSE